MYHYRMFDVTSWPELRAVGPALIAASRALVILVLLTEPCAPRVAPCYDGVVGATLLLLLLLCCRSTSQWQR
jgi:hypothetical protein